MDKLLDALLAQNILRGLNLLTIIGFVLMGIGLSQSRRGRTRVPAAFTLMTVGTICVIAGMYFGRPAS
ncbi:MAG TPA: hypothetical protein VLX67_02395 [Stellaceae bacterium]|nr:hypothetical protein [Stellaceae bacterium]